MVTSTNVAPPALSSASAPSMTWFTGPESGLSSAPKALRSTPIRRPFSASGTREDR